MRILIAHDSDEVYVEFTRALAGENGQLARARTVAECLEQATRTDFDLIFLRAGLSGSTLDNLCSRLKHDLASNAPDLVILSENGGGLAFQEEALNSGADDVISLPISTALLQSRVKSIARLRTARENPLDSNTLWEQVLTAVNDSVLVTDADDRIIAANPQAEATYGFTAKELRGCHLLDLTPNEAQPELVRYLQSPSVKGGVIFEAVQQCKDGTIINVEISSRPFFWHNAPHFAHVVRDIAERKYALDEIHYQLDYTRTITDSLAETVIAFDRNEIITFANRAAEDLLGWENEELIGRNFREVLATARATDRHIQINEDPLFAPLHSGKTIRNFEDVITRKDGTQFSVLLSSSPLYTRDDITGAIIAIRDITERKAAIEEIHALNASLERRVVERTAALLEANSELEAFSYSVSHDLRAPFRHIAGFANLLRKHSGSMLDERGTHYVSAIAEAAAYAGRLVDNLLSFSQMARTALRQTRVDMNSLLRDAMHDLNSDTAEQDIEWKIENLPDVVGDPTLLRQVLYNLISNAAKYSRNRDHQVIEIGSESSPEEHRFYVRDNGTGFDMKYVGKLFGVFQRLHKTEEFEGTGIGLANVQRIIKRHGGRVWAEGRLGEGATFYFSLPTGPKSDG